MKGCHPSLFSRSYFHPFLFFSLHVYFQVLICIFYCSGWALIKKKDLQSSSLSWEQTDNFFIPSSTLEFMGRAAGIGKLQGMFEIQSCLLHSVGSPESSCGAEEEFSRSPWVCKLPTHSYFHGCSIGALVAAAVCLQYILPSIPLFILPIQGLHEGPSLQISICCFVFLTFGFIDILIFQPDKASLLFSNSFSFFLYSKICQSWEITWTILWRLTQDCWTHFHAWLNAELNLMLQKWKVIDFR